MYNDVFVLVPPWLVYQRYCVNPDFCVLISVQHGGHLRAINYMICIRTELDETLCQALVYVYAANTELRPAGHHYDVLHLISIGNHYGDVR